MDSVIIVGGGVIGMICAFELKRRGFEVTVIERGKAGQESSWAGGGILSPLLPWRYHDAITELSLPSQKSYPGLLDALREFSDVDPNYLHSGMIMLDTDLDDTPHRWADRYDVQLERIDAAQIRDILPQASDSLTEAWWMPQIHQVRNPFLIQLLRDSLLNQGITLIEDCRVTGLDHNGKRIRGIQTETQNYQADSVVIAGGAWSRNILGKLGAMVDVYPVKGQMMLLKGEPGLLERITLVDQRYIIPRKDGHILVGSTTRHVAFNKQVEDTAIADMRAFARETVPILDTLDIKQHWCGLRPGTEQGIPYIGEHPLISGLFVCAGHYRNGLVTAPASTRLLAEMVSGEPLSLDPSPYALELPSTALASTA